MKIRSLIILTILAACGGKAAAPAPKGPDAPPVVAAPAAPTAESILDGAIEATGGRKAREAVTSMRASGTMRVAKIGIGGKASMILKVPNLMRVTMDIDGMGRTEQGSDGTTVWEKSAMTGARVLEGDERERTLRDNMWNSDLMWRELHTKWELVGEVEFDGKPAWKLSMTTTLGDVETWYFDRETKLQLGREAVVKSQMGEIPTRAVYLEYKTYGDIMIVNKAIQSASGVDMEITLDSVEINPTLAADAFAVPADVIPLIKK